MFICPYDLEACDGVRCASGLCERSRELCLITCLDCGELYEVGAAKLRLCTSCLIGASERAEGG